MQQAQLAEAMPVNRVGRAYGQVIRNTQSPREIEHQVFAQITAGLEAVSNVTLPGPRAEAIGRNRQLWDALTWSVIDDNNALPPALRQKIAGLGRWVNQECSRVLRENDSVAGLIEINRIIMQGLTPATAGATPCP